ncbi:hypothetical protein [Methylobacterium sp. ID0610]|uniref:hypothetical protein n=1 Tax=Methylobacterium carpenticola TaxID=3344827 RepID=UPI003685C62D
MLMMRRSIIIAMAIAAATAHQARGEAAGSAARDARPVRLYMMRGLGDRLTSSGIDDFAARIGELRPSTVIRVGNWYDWEEMAADALANPQARIVIVGYSMGSQSAARAANRLAASGIDVKMIGMDPYCVGSEVDASPHIRAVNIYMNSCGGAAQGQIMGADNIRLGDGTGGFSDHLAFPSNPLVQTMVYDEVFRDDFAARRSGSTVARVRPKRHATLR